MGRLGKFDRRPREDEGKWRLREGMQDSAGKRRGSGERQRDGKRRRSAQEKIKNRKREKSRRKQKRTELLRLPTPSPLSFSTTSSRNARAEIPLCSFSSQRQTRALQSATSCSGVATLQDQSTAQPFASSVLISLAGGPPGAGAILSAALLSHIL